VRACCKGENTAALGKIRFPQHLFFQVIYNLYYTEKEKNSFSKMSCVNFAVDSENKWWKVIWQQHINSITKGTTAANIIKHL
jgi:hypothetical protein